MTSEQLKEMLKTQDNGAETAISYGTYTQLPLSRLQFLIEDIKTLQRFLEDEGLGIDFLLKNIDLNAKPVASYLRLIPQTFEHPETSMLQNFRAPLRAYMSFPRMQHISGAGVISGFYNQNGSLGSEATKTPGSVLGLNTIALGYGYDGTNWRRQAVLADGSPAQPYSNYIYETPLGAGANVSPSFDTLNFPGYGHVAAYVSTDQNGTISILQCSNNSFAANTYTTQRVNIIAGTPIRIEKTIVARYITVSVTNTAAVAQTRLNFNARIYT